MEIVDAHHHVWRTRDMPWLSGPMVPRIFGPYEPIKRDYLIEEYIDDARSGGITQSVYVQANWPLHQVLAEVRWLADLHERTGWPTAVIGSADLFSPGAVEVMREQARLPVLRGTRLQLHWHEREEFRFASAPDRMTDPVFRENLAALADLGWLFELQVFPGQMAHAAELVAAFPDITFVLVHAGMLTSLDDADVGPWRTGMAALAALPNVVVKLTGQGTFVRRLDPEFIAFVATETVGWFGAERAMFGTNFPVEKLWTTMPDLVGAWRVALASLSEAERVSVFAATARRVYNLPETTAH
ncbi:amidohydrolase [Actinophytocola xinjiangensis]|uniref:Amidohydrolase n=1 Tax=Actinophytocola xinjiangensis TaxID=485602 RepID=A0A7Z1AZI7_9PSEU|nr:amidohydrolase family protein [Actinophytocola xinjiangensis]OLF12128.1 amidohydrolase [Actinophytocola xinjiangensis]